jgi:hypothetical protein
MFCFCGGGFQIRFVLYSLFCSMFFMVCLFLLVIGYVCNGFSRQLMPDSLCSYGWQELLGVILVCVRFLKLKLLY